ncbi:fam-f protein [Plasmodium relictum]|uniref:Fam-f protein n=1 Tax=Plasmodium relictum TaxID=85471 RepID=A0A1J1GK73_PLARL|nr:fam-f protein [Plasmodium relictum]CRG84705.1 fam-f protein [Plasmodium relictum]
MNNIIKFLMKKEDMNKRIFSVQIDSKNFIMPNFLFKNILKILINIDLYGNKAYNNSNRFKLKFVKYKEIQLIRDLAEVFNFADKDILNDAGLTIKEVQSLYNMNETKNEDTALEGFFVDSRLLFAKLVDLIFLKNFNEKLKQEKARVDSLCYALWIMNNKITGYMKSIRGNVNNHIDYVFDDLESFESELIAYTDVDAYININERSQDLLVNKQNAYDYFKKSELSKKIKLKPKKSFTFFNKLHERNNQFLSKINRQIYEYDIVVFSNLGKTVQRFPLKYVTVVTHSYMENFLAPMKGILNAFASAIFIENKKKGVSINTSLKVNIEYLNSLISDMHRILDATIASKTHKLFVRINKILNGDIKCLIAIIIFILEQDRCTNKLKLDYLKDKHGDEIFNDKFLSHIYELFLQEKDDLKKSLDEFKTYIRAIFGFTVNSSGIRSLVQMIYKSNEKDFILKLFHVIVHSLGCKRQLNYYSTFLEMLKRNSERSLIVKFINFFKERNEVLYIPKAKSRNVILSFLDIYDNSNIFFELKNINIKLIRQALEMDFSVRRFRGYDCLINLLIKELSKLKKNFIYSEEKRINKNAIIFLLYEIKEFNSYKKYRYIKYT